jgi:hypothetical protein
MLKEETVWLSQDQLTQLFHRDQSVISRHIRNVFKEGELDEKSNMQKMHIPNSDKPVVFYNLEVIISVGYRVKSKQGTQFRIWATKSSEVGHGVPRRKHGVSRSFRLLDISLCFCGPKNRLVAQVGLYPTQRCALRVFFVFLCDPSAASLLQSEYE